LNLPRAVATGSTIKRSIAMPINSTLVSIDSTSFG
jgi:hypothetical protein